VILFQAEELEETIRLTISDDGNGMNFEALREKGKKMGVVGESATNEELLNIIFLAGFSTKEEVTDVSGRGVGMDVVKRELEKIGGSISVKSETGTGSTFTLILPKSITTQIIQGYLIEVAGEPFIIPVKCVMESFHPDKANLVTMYDSMECLERRGDIMPVIPVASYLYDEEKPREHTIFVIVEEAGRQYALLVDKVIGIQQVVLKELNGMKMKKKIFSGAALMGNGNVALVLDLSAFLSTSTILQKRNN
jgi:two-component system chemotaxis sensor kinase CheA